MDDQPACDGLAKFASLGSFLGGNTQAVQAHTSLDKAGSKRLPDKLVIFFARLCLTGFLRSIYDSSQLSGRIAPLKTEELQMREISLSSEEVSTLNHERLYHPRTQVRRRMTVVWMRAKGRRQLDCAQIAGISMTHNFQTFENRSILIA